MNTKVEANAKVVEYKSKCIETNPKVSVVVITYNHKHHLEQCIESILNQKVNFDFEIILGEDDSTDNTREICIKYATKYSDKVRLFLHDSINKIYLSGKPTGRFNLLYSLSQCRGNYIALCEGDDYWTDPNKLQKQVDFLEANPHYSGCFHDTKVEYVNNDKPSHLFRDNLPKSMNAEDTIALFAPFHTSSFMFKRDCFTFQPFLSKVKSGDMAIFSIIASGGLLGKVDGIMSVYRKHEGGITNSVAHNKNFHQDRIQLIQYLNDFHQYKYDAKARKVIQAHRKKIESSFGTNSFIKLFKNIILFFLNNCKRVYKKSIKI